MRKTWSRDREGADYGKAFATKLPVDQLIAKRFGRSVIPYSRWTGKLRVSRRRAFLGCAGNGGSTGSPKIGYLHSSPRPLDFPAGSTRVRASLGVLESNNDGCILSFITELFRLLFRLFVRSLWLWQRKTKSPK